MGKIKMCVQNNYLENCICENGQELRIMLKEAFASLITRFNNLSKRYDAGYVTYDISYYYTATEMEGSIESIAFYMERLNFIIHLMDDGTFKLIEKTDAHAEVYSFECKEDVINKVNLSIEHIIQETPTQKKFSDNGEFKKLFKDDTVDMIQYPLSDEDKHILQFLLLVSDFINIKTNKVGNIERHSEKNQSLYYSVLLKERKSMRISNLNENLFLVSLTENGIEKNVTLEVKDVFTYVKSVVKHNYKHEK